MKEAILKEIIHCGTVKRATLLYCMQIKYPELKDRKMRHLINEIIQEGECIQSSNNGYTLITSQEQLYEAVGYLNKKVVSLAIRKNTLIKNFNLKLQPGNQIALDL